MPRLFAAGHHAIAVPLSGVGERAHQMSPAITLGTHVEDVVTAVRAAECAGAVLVGHSYAGMVITGAADLLEDSVGPLIYVDAVVPEAGESWSSQNPPEVRTQRRAAIARTGVLPPPPAAAFGLVGPDADWVERRQTPQPGGVYDDPLSFVVERWAARPRTYVDCTAPPLPSIDPSRERMRSQPGWDIVELATGHDPMISAPDELAEVLLAASAG
jgi:pimeloyl-ACP methyl ester carboxylesterase